MRWALPISCILILACVAGASGTTVVWYGANCTDEHGVSLEEGDLIQLIRSPDGTIGAPESMTGEPTGDDSVADTAAYISSGGVFQGEDWQELDGSYVCVRVWNDGSAETGTCYWDSKAYQASGVLPVDIDCSGAETNKLKQPSGPTATPTATVPPTSTPMPAPPAPTPVVDLAPNKTVVETGDTLIMNLAINEPISDGGKLVMYVLVSTQQGGWFSFVPGKGGSFILQRGIKSAMSGVVIPPLDAPILRQNIGGSLARGDYWFAAAIFHVGGRISLADWRSKAIYASESTVTVR